MGHTDRSCNRLQSGYFVGKVRKNGEIIKNSLYLWVDSSFPGMDLTKQENLLLTLSTETAD